MFTNIIAACRFNSSQDGLDLFSFLMGRNMSTDGQTQIKLAALDKLAAWAAGQPFTNVLLTMCIALVAVCFWYGVPIHLAQIQAGYEKIEKMQTDQLRSRDEEMSRAFELLQAVLNKHADGNVPARVVPPGNLAGVGND